MTLDDVPNRDHFSSHQISVVVLYNLYPMKHADQIPIIVCALYKPTVIYCQLQSHRIPTLVGRNPINFFSHPQVFLLCTPKNAGLNDLRELSDRFKTYVYNFCLEAKAGMFSLILSIRLKAKDIF